MTPHGENLLELQLMADAGMEPQDVLVATTRTAAELMGRLRASLRRTRPRAALGRLRVGDLEVDPASREVRLRGRRVELSAKEFELLAVLVTEPTRVFTKAELLRDVWGFRCAGRTRTLDSHACRLRVKLGVVAGDRFIVNVWGVGYRLVDAVSLTHSRAA